MPFNRLNGKCQNKQGEKSKICRLAIASVLLSIAGVCLLALLLYWENPYSMTPYYHQRPFYAYGHLVTGLMAAAGIGAGIFAIMEMRGKRRDLKGKGAAICGVVISAVFIFFWIWHLPNSPFTARKRCAANLRTLGKTMLIYAGDYDEKYPTADKWCDLLLQSRPGSEGDFVCPSGGKERCHYAINPNTSPLTSPRVMLLFETKGGWNQSGGPELLSMDNHGGEGCNVLFNDLHVEFVKKEEFGKLNWGTAAPSANEKAKIKIDSQINFGTKH